MTLALALVAAGDLGRAQHDRVGRDLAGEDDRLVVDRDPDVLAGEQLLQRLLQGRDAGIDDDVVLLAPAAPQTIRLTVPALLPSISTSRGCTTTASAIFGSVMAMRVMSKAVVSTIERPAVSISTRSRSSRRARWPAAGGCAGTVAAAPARGAGGGV